MTMELLMVLLGLLATSVIALFGLVYRSNSRILNGHEHRLEVHTEHIRECDEQNSEMRERLGAFQGTVKVELGHIKDAVAGSHDELKEIKKMFDKRPCLISQCGLDETGELAQEIARLIVPGGRKK